MRIIHTSDLHLDSPLTTRLSADRVRERKRELLASFRNNVIEAQRLDATAFIIAGDLFDSEKASADTVKMLFDVIAATPSITFFYIYGNHEGRLIVDSGVQIPDNLKLFGDEWTYFRIGDVTVTGRCETSKGMFSNLMLDPAKQNIVILHGELCDRSDEGGKIGIKEMEDLPIDYLALGHYHSYSETKISARTTAVYSGTPEGRGFDEAGDKGIVLLETTPYGIKKEFIKTAGRTLHIVEADVTLAKRGIDVEDAVERAIRGCAREDIVRVVLTGERSLTERIESEAIIESLGSRFAGRFYYIEFKDGLKTKISAEEFKLDRSLKGEFIRGVIADTSLTEAEKEKIIRMGLRALLGESVD